ncbi:hypothetical protein DRP07_10745 [Archaeoglobales archaeon]|nr:MAG: hypothetical protein DRP07_10745 [Archaeoglobales archaeon]
MLEEREKEKAAQRKAEGQRKGGKERWKAKEEGKEELPRKLRKSKKHQRESKAIAAKKVGWSRKTYEKAKEIVEAAENSRQIFKKLVKFVGKIKVLSVTSLLNRLYHELGHINISFFHIHWLGHSSRFH